LDISSGILEQKKSRSHLEISSERIKKLINKQKVQRQAVKNLLF
jgi:hypothetical protein